MTPSGKRYNLLNFVFIPNNSFEEIDGIIARDREDFVNILYSRSDYGSDKRWVNAYKSDEFKYPVIHSINVKNELRIIWSKEDRGHFGIPKLIFGRRWSGIYIDMDGKFGISQDCRAIIDNPENLENIKKAMESTRFIKLMTACNTLSTAYDKYDKNVLACFRKDFWKDFV
jgi:hypothetical protein